MNNGDLPLCDEVVMDRHGFMNRQRSIMKLVTLMTEKTPPKGMMCACNDGGDSGDSVEEAAKRTEIEGSYSSTP